MPAEAGEVIVDLRRTGEFRHQRLVFGALFVVLALAVVGNPSAWPVLAFFAFIAIVTWLILGFLGSVRAVCDRGVVVRRRWSRHVVAWSDVRGLRQRRLADSGGRFTLTFVETDRYAAPLPRAFGARANGEVAAAIRTIEERANVKLVFATGSPSRSRGRY